MTSLIHSKENNEYTFYTKTFNLLAKTTKGELGLYILTDNRNKIYRIKIRSPDYYNFQSINIICHNHLIADVISILGTTDFVLGSVDHPLSHIS